MVGAILVTGLRCLSVNWDLSRDLFMFITLNICLCMYIEPNNLIILCTLLHNLKKFGFT